MIFLSFPQIYLSKNCNNDLLPQPDGGERSERGIDEDDEEELRVNAVEDAREGDQVDHGGHCPRWGPHAWLASQGRARMG